MKINIISDIHATVKNNKVIYDNDYLYLDSEYITFIKQILKFFKTNKNKIKTYKFCDKIIVNYESIISLLVSTLSISNNFNDLTLELTNYFNSAYNELSKFVLINNINFDYSNFFILKNNKIIHFYDIKEWILKHYFDFDPSKLESADYLIIAGDLGYENTYDTILNDIKQKTNGKFKKILSIAGNHDHWWFKFNSTDEYPKSINLDRDYIYHEDNDYIFVGCTLWTPISDSRLNIVKYRMNDYNFTPGKNYEKFSPIMSRKQYEIQSTWLKNKIFANKNKKIVVITHHQPFKELIDNDKKHSDIKDAYVVTDGSLNDINQFNNIKIWCCGHTHQNFDGTINNVHVVRNPIGYRDIYGFLPSENISTTRYSKVINI